MHTILNRLRGFAHAHDDLPAFHAGYLVLILIAAALFNVGTFALLIAVHMSLDYVKYREIHKLSLLGTLEGIVRESLMDIALLSVGLVSAVYMHYQVGIGAFSAVLRADIVFVRFAATVLPRAAILHNILKVVSHLRHYLLSVHRNLNAPWTPIEQLCIFFITTSFLLILFAPEFLGESSDVIYSIVADQLRPFGF